MSGVLDLFLIFNNGSDGFRVLDGSLALPSPKFIILVLESGGLPNSFFTI